MNKRLWIFPAVMAVSALAVAQATSRPAVVVELSKALKGGGGLGTMAYQPTETEAGFQKKVTEKPIDLWADIEMPKAQNMTGAEWEQMQKEEQAAKKNVIPVDEYQLKDQVGQYVGWFGIVRGVEWDKAKGTAEYLLEHKYFDGLTDLHIQIVSIYGAGDFSATVPDGAEEIGMLSLVRVYGQVSGGRGGLPSIRADYVRVWDWGLFSFMDYGKDKTNPRWVKLRQVKGEDAYSPRPTARYYEARLGPREAVARPDRSRGKQ